MTANVMKWANYHDYLSDKILGLRADITARDNWAMKWANHYNRSEVVKYIKDLIEKK
jgi:hypothetical protein